MANADWSWKPGKTAPRQKLNSDPDAAVSIKGSPRTTIPASTSKTEEAQTGGWGHGLGNNVNNTMNGFNAAHDKAANAMDRKHAKFFQARRKQRKKDKAMRRLHGPKACQRPTIVKPGPTIINNAPRLNIITSGPGHLSAGTCDVALQDWQKHGINRARGKH